jgi:hypothetical protein
MNRPEPMKVYNLPNLSYPRQKMTEDFGQSIILYSDHIEYNSEFWCEEPVKALTGEDEDEKSMIGAETKYRNIRHFAKRSVCASVELNYAPEYEDWLICVFIMGDTQDIYFRVETAKESEEIYEAIKAWMLTE